MNNGPKEQKDVENALKKTERDRQQGTGAKDRDVRPRNSGTWDERQREGMERLEKIQRQKQEPA